MEKTETLASTSSAQARPAFVLNRDRSISQQVYEDLRARIVSLELEPGTNFSGTKLATHYGVSQMPVREALLKLQQDGLVDIFRQSKTVVAPIDVQKVKEAQFLRSSMEIEVSKLLARDPDKARLAEPRRIYEEHRRQVESHTDDDAFYLLDGGFHRALFEAAGYDGLWTLVQERSGHLDRVRRLQIPSPGKPHRVIEEHGRILDAIKASNVDGVDREMRKHLSGALNELGGIIEKHPDFFAD
jgi:DNA-binding GntR family transcriptional regulator